MKKIIAAILATLALALTGCGGTVVNNALLDETKPWKNAAGYEKIVYTINRYAMKRDGNTSVYDGEPLATGSLILTLNDATGESSGTTDVTTDFSLTYSDDERNGTSKGLTDTMVSSCTFRNTGCLPLNSYRKVTIAPREGETLNMSYEITCDYSSGGTSVLNMHGEEKTMSVSPSGQFFDNEQLFFILRAFQNVKTSGSVSFNYSNLFDAHLENSYSTYSLGLSIAEERETMLVGEWATSYATLDADGNPSIEADGSGNAKLDCLVGSLQKAGTQSGPYLTFKFSNVPFRIDDSYSTKKVITQYITREYSSAEESYNTVYTIDSYTTVKE